MIQACPKSLTQHWILQFRKWFKYLLLAYVVYLFIAITVMKSIGKTDVLRFFGFMDVWVMSDGTVKLGFYNFGIFRILKDVVTLPYVLFIWWMQDKYSMAYGLIFLLLGYIFWMKKMAKTSLKVA